MIVHPNPMLQERVGYWQDTKLRQVRVEPRLLNRGNHRQRWIVLQQHRHGREVVSSHIMEAAAVVAAQTLANRLWRQLNKSTKRKTKSTRPVKL